MGGVGDIETRNNNTTYTYGVGISPTTGELTATDSGKVIYKSIFVPETYQSGTPSIHTYALDSAVDVTTMGSSDSQFTDYLGNGEFSVSTMAASGSLGENTGLGKMYASLAERSTIELVGDNGEHGRTNLYNGPRGVVYTADGTGWIVNSESPVGTDNAVLRLTEPGDLGTSIGRTLKSGTEWGLHRQPGTFFYHTGIDTDSTGTKLFVNSEVAETVQVYDTTTSTWQALVLKDLVSGRNADVYSVAVDKQDNSLYLPFTRDGLGSRAPFLEKRAADAASVTGEFVRDFTNAQFPGLTTPRDVEFDANGRMYVSVAEGTNNTRVMILGKTPDSIDSACLGFAPGGVSYRLHINCGDGVDPLKPEYQQTQLLDYVVEAREVGTTDWRVVGKPSSTDPVQDLTALDTSRQYEVRVYALNEAGASDPVNARVLESRLFADAFIAESGQPVRGNVLGNDFMAGSETINEIVFMPDITDPATTTSSMETEEGSWSITVDGEFSFTSAAGFSGDTDSYWIGVRIGDCWLYQEFAGHVREGEPSGPEPTDEPTKTPNGRINDQAPTQGTLSQSYLAQSGANLSAGLWALLALATGALVLGISRTLHMRQSK